MARYSIGAGIGIAVMAMVAEAPPASAAEVGEQQYALPAQPLSKSLRDVALQSGTSIIAPSELVGARQAPALQGRFGAKAAVARLIEGSGLRFKVIGDALVITQNGEDEGEPQTVVVTGSNLRGSQPTSPVIAIGRRDIEASGANSVEQLMRKLPQNAQGGVNRENFRSVGAGADPTEHGAGLNLRGLGQRATLVLVNGRRLAPSNAGSFVDISLIPLSAIDRVEVLTDGASAVYGSDAVGGVVNFILKDDFEGVEASALAGSATSGDGDVRQASLAAGTRWHSGGAMLAYEYRGEDGIDARDRDFTINLAPGTSILPTERRHSVFGSLSQQLGTSAEAELTGIWSRRETSRSYFFTGSPVPVGLDAGAFMLGLSGTVRYELPGDWEARLAGGYSRTRTDQVQDQPDGQGLVNFRKTSNRLADGKLAADGSLFRLPGGSVRVALGVEWRHETFDDLFRTEQISSPITASRNVWAAFGEAQLPIVGPENRMPGVERLVLSAAGRFEHYDDFGSTFDPKLGLLWSPLAGLSFRTSYSTSFRAPLLYETAGAYSAIYVPASLVFVTPPPPTGVALALGGSNPDVKPERSRSWTIGAEYSPPTVPGLKLGLNLYSIRFSDRIALPSQTIAVVGDPAFDSIVSHDPDDGLVSDLIDGAQVAIDISGPGFSNGHATPADVIVIIDGRINNTAKTVTKGLDANLAYGFQWKGSDFRLDANLNYIFSFKDQLRPGSQTIETLDSPFHPLDLRFRLHGGWSRDGWAANLFLNHTDGYRDNRGNRSLSVGSWTTLDAGISYSVGSGSLKGLGVALNAENLFDEDPPRLLPEPGSSAGLGYDPVNASGRGRFISLQLRKNW